MNSNQRFRARVVLFLIIVAAGVIASSLYFNQIVNGGDYVSKAEKQYAKPATALFDRGTIFFSSKDGTKPAAAAIERGYLIYMDPTKITDKEGAYQALSHYLTLDKSDFIKKASKDKDVYEELVHKVNDTVASSVKSLSIPGIGMVRETWRTYPGDGLAAHTLGIIGESGDGVKGRYGLERTYENVLKRTAADSGGNVFAELFSGIAGSVFGDEKKGDVVTTVEPTVQGYVENVLKKIDSAWSPDETGIIVMDPKTGEILAMGALPAFDPNDLSKIKNVGVLSNPLVEHVYEMGSIVKPLTMALGLDSGAITLETKYEDTGTMTLSGKKISNFDGKARGISTMQDVLSHSLNVGAATIALKAGKDTFTKYFTSFGFASKTGIDLPNEAAGIADNLKTGRDIEIATASYGQGIAVSPIAITRAMSVLANGGYLVTPHITKEIKYTDGSSDKITPKRSGPVLKDETVEEVTGMLVRVVDTALKDGAIKMEHHSIAAKTGTAQIPDPSKGGYYTDRYLHSFFGYFPAYDPRFIVFLYQINPKGANFASETLTEPFSEIAKFLISYYEIAPDR